MTRIIRSPSTVTTDITFEASMNFGDALIAPIITSTQNNYAPIGLQETIVLDISSDANRTITGIEAPNPIGTRVLYVFNIGTNNIVFKDNDSGSLPANRILLGANKTVQSDEGLILVYDNLEMIWKVPAINV
jgi:hypothetical protein